VTELRLGWGDETRSRRAPSSTFSCLPLPSILRSFHCFKFSPEANRETRCPCLIRLGRANKKLFLRATPRALFFLLFFFSQSHSHRHLSSPPSQHKIPAMLIDLFPRAGFHWKHTRGGPPRIMCRDSRDAKVQRALIELSKSSSSPCVRSRDLHTLVDGPERKMKKRDAQVIIVDAINTVAEAYASPQHAIRASEGILRFLGRASTFCKLASMMPQDVWKVVSPWVPGCPTTPRETR